VFSSNFGSAVSINKKNFLSRRQSKPRNIEDRVIRPRQSV
jgi:hypothetical protein